MCSRRPRAAAWAVALACLTLPPGASWAGLSSLESSCARKLATAATRLSALWMQADIGCRLSVATGQGSGPCPGEAGDLAIAPVVARIVARAERYCGSVCSISTQIPCVSDAQCPPLPPAGIAEACSAGVANRPFDMKNIGFPGPFCEDALGRPVESREDIAGCVRDLTISAASALGAVTLGEAPPTPLVGSTLTCQRVIAKRARRLAVVAQRTLTRCRNDILIGARLANPRDCATSDSLYVTRTTKLRNKLRRAVEAACSDEDIRALDLCGVGRGGVPTAAEAVLCVAAATAEVVESAAPPDTRSYSPHTLIDAAYPPPETCGDGRVNQKPSAFLPLGEECDGADDEACPGNCIPPGDVFECSCADRPRLRLLTDNVGTALDQGWTGTALDAKLPEGSGYVIGLSGCDCSQMDGATCVGTASDSVCEVAGVQQPRCSWEWPAGPRCDQRGDGNFVDNDRDCWICDDYSVNAGHSCQNEGDCVPQCYDADGLPGAPCPRGQQDCPSGETCRGRCDREPTCIQLPHAPPSPVAAGGSSICVVQTPREDLSGTTDIVTGEHAITERTRVRIFLGITASLPCPVCGGFCTGGPFDGEVCRGSCSKTRLPCRFDSDCDDTEFCSAVSADCPEGSCNLGLLCHGGANDGLPCRLESDTGALGTVSNDCPPALNANISGNGLTVDYAPATSELSSLESEVPCSAPGYELFDCPCPDDGGRRTQPNDCRPACNAGAQAGTACADGDNSSGRFTTCAGGINDGRACDEDADCPGSACNANPHHCVGDPLFERVACSTDSDCGAGACVDACPLGRCVPLCAPDPEDPERGLCAAGPTVYHCSGPLDEFRVCYREDAEAGCAATCGTSLTPCTSIADCPPNEACIGSCPRARFCEAGFDGVLGTVDDLAGAGLCSAGSTLCPLEPLAAEGGDLLNGKGDPSHPRSAATFCLGRTGNTGINTVVGVGGPGRLRRTGRYATNGFSSLP